MRAYKLTKWKGGKDELRDVQTAIDKLRAGEIVGRAVVVPDGH